MTDDSNNYNKNKTSSHSLSTNYNPETHISFLITGNNTIR